MRPGEAQSCHVGTLSTGFAQVHFKKKLSTVLNLRKLASFCQCPLREVQSMVEYNQNCSLLARVLTQLNRACIVSDTQRSSELDPIGRNYPMDLVCAHVLKSHRDNRVDRVDVSRNRHTHYLNSARRESPPVDPNWVPALRVHPSS
jgi:hypothetical protein